MIWKVPKMWEGETVFIIGGGPSLNDLDLSLIHDKRCIGVNNAYRLGDWVDICWFGDSRWLEWHQNRKNLRDGWREFAGIRASSAARIKDHKDIKYVALSQGKPYGIETDPYKICWNKTSGTSAINLAYHLGASKIVLLGFDMQIVDNKHNWHDEHIVHGDKADPYDRFMKCWKDLTTELKALGRDMVNCSVTSAIPEELVRKQEYLEAVEESNESKSGKEKEY